MLIISPSRSASSRKFSVKMKYGAQVNPYFISIQKPNLRKDKWIAHGQTLSFFFNLSHHRHTHPSFSEPLSRLRLRQLCSGVWFLVLEGQRETSVGGP